MLSERVCEDAEWEDCYNCANGVVGHDCGEDTCCCLNPEENMTCTVCDGKEGWYVGIPAGSEIKK